MTTITTTIGNTLTIFFGGIILVKMLMVENCKDCIYCFYSESKGEYLCTQTNETLGWTDTPIPNSCPLEDYKFHVIDGSRILSDENATTEIKRILRELKDSGRENFSILDISSTTNLPPKQINKIIEELRK